MKDFEKLLELVKNGIPVYKALLELNIQSRGHFYDKLTINQKRQLKEIALLKPKKNIHPKLRGIGYNMDNINGFEEF